MAEKELRLNWLLCGSLIVSIGSSLLWPLTTIYLHNYLHQNLTTAGVVLFINSLALILGSYLGGIIYDRDRANVRRWLLLAIFLATLAVFLLIFFNGWPTFALLLLVDNFGGGVSTTLVNSLATGIKEKSSRQVFNLMYFMQNVGVVIGTLLVGFIVEIDIRWIFITNFVLFLFFLVIVYRHYYVPKAALSHVSPGQPTAQQVKRTPVRYVIVIFAILGLFFAIEAGYSQWQSNLSIYMESLGISVKNYGFLWTINGLVIVFGQPLLNKLLDDCLEVKLVNKIYLGASLFTLGFVTLLYAQTYVHFVVTMIIITLGEILTFPTIPALVDTLSTLGEKGKYQGAVSIFAALGRAIGPLVGGILIDGFSYQVLFLAMIGLMALATVNLLFVAKINLSKK
ncbi:MDR family MFS transporter [Ligilactobacillus apodemi]|uniref:MDR family MFS transporter n=1 Tax=Ligilactobacillus apodemi TaxID=307126 RepID=UPI00214CD6DB|nr:MFS transporter [Ligilactobacillus apodemi]MCR1901842.1 MFS transporter [Ligilactobacillus apodemi]